ncbi:NUDIX domain-containing protein, partial [Candidatus Saccharibacteria bacterium]|nr:NUDIX domain-containing protein [Candidatus Saccharibacteria bacterium]
MARHVTCTAVFVLLERKEKYLFLRRANTGWSDGKLTLPSGHVDQGQTVRQAAAVEALEETGVVIQEEDLEFMFTHYVLDTYVNFYFKARRWEGEPY